MKIRVKNLLVALALLAFSTPCRAEATRRRVNSMLRLNRLKPGQWLAKGACLIAFSLLSFSTAFAQTPAGTAFTYSGQLQTNGIPVTGLYDFQCILSNAPDGSGIQLGSTLTTNAVGVTNGLFNFILDFGGVFTGNATWLALSVRTNSYGGTPGVFQLLNPLQELTPVPYAIFAEKSGNVTGAGNSGGGSGNFFVGPAGNSATTGSFNTAGGNAALDAIASGSANTAFGAGALFTNSLGSFNVAYGDGALQSNSVGSYNTAIGSSALYGNTTGSNNIALGYQAGDQITTGSSNIDIGNLGVATDTNIIRIGSGQTNTYIAGVINGNGGGLTNLNASALTSVGNNNGGNGNFFVGNSGNSTTSGSFNTANGGGALSQNTSGSGNTAFGSDALESSTSGGNNTAIGLLALVNLGYPSGNGHDNIALGYGAGGNFHTTESYNIDIGNGGTQNDQNTIRIGDPNFQTTTYIAGIYGVTLTGGYQVYVDSSGHLGTGGSGGGGGPLPSYVVTNNDTAPITFLSSLTLGTVLNLPGTTPTVSDIISSGGTMPLLFNDNEGNFCVGQSAGNGLVNFTHNSYNTAVGVQSLFTDENGPGNTAVGYQALYNNAAISGHNTAVGYQALSTNTSGGNNIALGYQAGSALTGGSGNIDIGNIGTSSDANIIRIGSSQTATYIAGVINGNGSGLTGLEASHMSGVLTNGAGGVNIAGTFTGTFSGNGGGLTNLNASQLTSVGNSGGGSGNFFVGPSGNSTTTGYNNTAIGVSALTNATPYFDYGNTAVGNSALQLGNFLEYNTAIGYEALNQLGQGPNGATQNNIAMGYQAGYNFTGLESYNIDIGNMGVAGENNTIRIGTSGPQTSAFIAGISGATISGGAAVYVDTSTGQLGVESSSARFKTDIQSMGDASDVLLALKPVTFKYKPGIDPKGIPQFGLVAEQVENVDPELVVHDDQHGIYTVRYEAVNAMLLNEFQKEHRTVEEQKTEIQELKSRLEKLEQLMATKEGGEQ